MQGGFSAHKVYTPLLVWMVFSHWFLSFTRSVVQHIIYFLSLVYQPCMIWTVSWGLRFWGSFWGFNISDIFVGGSKMVWWNLRSFPHDLVCLIYQSSWRSLILSLGWFYTSTAMSLWWSCWVLVSCFTGSRGSKSIGGTSPCLKEITCLLVLSLCNKEGLDGIPFLISY